MEDGDRPRFARTSAVPSRPASIAWVRRAGAPKPGPVIRRAVVIVALAAAWLVPAGAAASDPGPPVAVIGAPIPADAPVPVAASLLRPAALHATFRVPRAATALYIGTPWYVRSLTAVVTGPGRRRDVIVATADLPGHMLGLRLPPDAWQADRIDADAITVSTAVPPYLLPAEQLAVIGWHNWSDAAFFGLFVALALAGAGLALVRRSLAAAWYALSFGAQAGMLIPWLGIVRPPPEVSQPAHAVLQSLAFVALTLFSLAFLRVLRLSPRAVTALWTLVALNVVIVVAGDVLQDLYPLPDLATQAIPAALDLTFVALGIIGVARNGAGARTYLAATAVGALAFITATVGALAAVPLLQSAAQAGTALEALLLGLALVTSFTSTAADAAAPLVRTPERDRLRPAHLDGLTEIPNRLALDEHLAAAWGRARDTREPLAAILVDVDHFRKYNEAYGHLAGDDVLRRIAAALAAVTSRDDDVTGRYGGDTFLMLLGRSDLDGARHVADAARDAIAALDLAHGDVPARRVTASIGVAAVTATRTDASELVRRADTALYIAKSMGRNRVVVDEPAQPPAALQET